MNELEKQGTVFPVAFFKSPLLQEVCLWNLSKNKVEHLRQSYTSLWTDVFEVFLKCFYTL